jgi:hypothetical protein
MTHALAEKRRRLMRGIARQINLAGFPPLGDQSVKTIGGGADEFVRSRLRPMAPASASRFAAASSRSRFRLAAA